MHSFEFTYTNYQILSFLDGDDKYEPLNNRNLAD